MMSRIKFAGGGCYGLSIMIAVGSILASASLSRAQDCLRYFGTAVTGQSVTLNYCSIRSHSSRRIDFSYRLGSQNINARANCDQERWTTLHDGVTHRPQSQATTAMISYICSVAAEQLSDVAEYGSQGSQTSTAVVFDPPSNVRVSPGGGILCSIRSRQSINITGSTGEWYYTDACGDSGVIHRSQVQFHGSQGSQTSTAVVFDPPSNVRVSPGGGILCSIRSRQSINITGSTGEWYYTDACGDSGVIHRSQVRF